MSDPLEIEIQATHLYRGATGRLRVAARLESGPLPAIALFSDQAVASAEFRLERNGVGRLTVAPCRTTRGTEISKKTWRLSLEGQGNERRFKVLAQED